MSNARGRPAGLDAREGVDILERSLYILQRAFQNLFTIAEVTPPVSAPLTRIDKQRFGPWALVTGASSSIGEALARQLAASGLNLILVARRAALLERLGHELQSTFGIDYRVVTLDLTSDDILTPIRAATDDLEVGLLSQTPADLSPDSSSDLRARRSSVR